MKRLLVCILAFCLLCGCAGAEGKTAPRYTKGWEVEVSGISIVFPDEEIRLEPSLRIRLITDDYYANAQMSVAVIKDGETLAELQAEDSMVSNGSFSLDNCDARCEVNSLTHNTSVHSLLLFQCATSFVASMENITLPAALVSFRHMAGKEEKAKETIRNFFLGTDTLNGAPRLPLATDMDCTVEVRTFTPEGPLFRLDEKRDAGFESLGKGLWQNPEISEALTQAINAVTGEDSVAKVMDYLKNHSTDETAPQ